MFGGDSKTMRFPSGDQTGRTLVSGGVMRLVTPRANSSIHVDPKRTTATRVPSGASSSSVLASEAPVPVVPRDLPCRSYQVSRRLPAPAVVAYNRTPVEETAKSPLPAP